jgi:predicted O-methyltransferase YrrM
MIVMMSQEQWAVVDSYINDLFVPADPALEAALKASSEAGLPEIQVSPAQGKLLYVLAQAMRARRILEIGTLGGYSTIWMARALPPGGSLVTLELNARHAEVARANIAHAGLAEKVDIRIGRAQETLPRLAAENPAPFDLVFLDADKPGYSEYFRWALQLTRHGSLIIADNIVRDGEVANSSSQDADVQGVRRFNELVAAEPRVSATVVQTVGSKGYDGFAVAVVVA